jgi:O-antigen ligase
MGAGLYAGAVTTALVNGVYLGYLFALYSVRQKNLRNILPSRFCNYFGFATTIAALLLVWSGLSFRWTPAPVTAYAYYLAYVVQVLISFMLCKLYPIRDVFRNACKGTAYAAAISTPLAFIFVGFAGGRLGGEGGNSMIGAVSMPAIFGTLSVAYLVLDRSMSKLTAILLLIPYVLSLVFSFNKTGLIALVIATIVYVLLAPGSTARRITRIVYLVIGLAIVLLALSSKILSYTSHSGNIETFTGRTIIWVQTIAQIRNGPWLRGFGILAYRTIGPIADANGDHLVHAHNDFLTVWFNYGLIGVVLVFGSYLALAYSSFKSIRLGGGFSSVLAFCVFVFYFTSGITAASAMMCLFPTPWLLLLDSLVSTHLTKADRYLSLSRSHTVRL